VQLTAIAVEIVFNYPTNQFLFRGQKVLQAHQIKFLTLFGEFKEQIPFQTSPSWFRASSI